MNVARLGPTALISMDCAVAPLRTNPGMGVSAMPPIATRAEMLVRRAVSAPNAGSGACVKKARSQDARVAFLKANEIGL